MTSLDEKDRTVFQFETDLYFLCNPWLKEDIYGVESTEQITEYVMNEHGQLYLGTLDRPRPVPWYFGQFEASVLLTALALLEKTSAKMDGTLIPRLLATKIRTRPNGNPHGIFGLVPTIRPLPAPGSGYVSGPTILKNYLHTDQHQGSLYDSNWQHAAILCSLCRALGIPARPVTVFNAIRGTDQHEERTPYPNTKLIVESSATRYVMEFLCLSCSVWIIRSLLFQGHGIYGLNVGCIGMIWQQSIPVGKCSIRRV